MLAQITRSETDVADWGKYPGTPYPTYTWNDVSLELLSLLPVTVLAFSLQPTQLGYGRVVEEQHVAHQFWYPGL